MSEEKIQQYNGQKVRSIWDDLREEWWMLKEEGSELTTNCSQLKMVANN